MLKALKELYFHVFQFISLLLFTYVTDSFIRIGICVLFSSWNNNLLDFMISERIMRKKSLYSDVQN